MASREKLPIVKLLLFLGFAKTSTSRSVCLSVKGIYHLNRDRDTFEIVAVRRKLCFGKYVVKILEI
jgi:hypothetical protein